MDSIYTTKEISDRLKDELGQTLKNLDFGSVEIYVNDGQVVQITKRQIKKTSNQKTN